MDKYTDEAIALLQQLIATPSTSRDEKMQPTSCKGTSKALA